MQFRKDYLNCTLASVPYLLPYGQSIADYAAALRVNPAGARLWNAVTSGADRKEMLSVLRGGCEAEDADLSALERDLDLFLETLTARGMTWSEPVSPFAERRIQIGPLRIALKVPNTLWEKYFKDFACREPGEPHQRILVCLQPPVSRANGTILVRSRDLIIAESGTDYLFLPLAEPGNREMHVAKDGSAATLYCPSLTDADTEQLFHAIRFAFLVAAMQQELYVVHSASLLYRDRAWLFSGASGVGKSTHTGLWQKTFGTPVLNGDLNLIGIEGEQPVCYGLPWNGTSGIRTAGSWPLGGITFLKQAGTDEVSQPGADRRILSLMQRIISPSWTAAQLMQTKAFCERLTGLTPIFGLCCTREPTAAHVMKEAIDSLMNDR